MRVTISKQGKDRFSVFVRRTRREEEVVKGEQDVPQDQLGAAIETLVKKTRREGT